MKSSTPHHADVDAGMSRTIAALHHTVGLYRLRRWLDHHVAPGERVHALALGHQGPRTVALAVTDDRAILLGDPADGAAPISYPLHEISAIERTRHGNSCALRVSSSSSSSFMLRVPLAEAEKVVAAMTSRSPAGV